MYVLLVKWGFLSKDTYHNGSNYKQGGEKYTIALGLAEGPDFLSRPELRVFASYLNDSENGKPSKMGHLMTRGTLCPSGSLVIVKIT